ncbi:LOW QUALITY PROTEIN: Cytochrome P450, E-class, group I [Trema orientale]|uniref:Cytochrome P450, E-class, group I n=1 Tax=Trema orientale TaxID=63057 RepID=A0A2P5F567_TREOI|nr:LOW QUALITY PROTEIN: Cytochrome P450, E-class, group I [Trema orientale]
MWSTWLEYARNDNDELVVGPILTTLFLTLLPLVLLIIFLLHRRKSTQTIPASPLPPGPTGLPLVGYLPFLRTDLHRQFTELSSLYGPIYKLWLGKKLCVVIGSTSLAKQVLRDHDTVFANHDMSVTAYVATYGGNDIVFQPYGPEWKKLRKIFVREMLSKSSLDGMYGLRREEVMKSVRHVYDVVYKAGTSPVDFGSLAGSTVVNVIMSMIGGVSLKAGEKTIDGVEFRKLTTELMVLIGKPNVSDLFPGLAWLDIQGIERETKKVIRVFDAMFGSAIEERKRIITEGGGEVQRKDFLQLLLEMINDHDHEDGTNATTISLAQLKAILMIIGHCSGWNGHNNDCAGMGNGRASQESRGNEVQEELTQVVGLTNTVEDFHLSKLTYLNAVIKETLRLHPPVPLLVPRYPSQSTTIGGYNVPKGAKIFLNVWAMHKDPSNWENPLEFRPERFLNNSDDDDDDASKFDLLGNNFNFIPFGSGRRACAGVPLAERMLLYVLASFLHAFEWELPCGGKVELSEICGIVLKKREPLLIFPTPRLSIIYR